MFSKSDININIILRSLLPINLINSNFFKPILLYNLDFNISKLYFYYKVIYNRKSYIKLLVEPNKVVRVYSSSIVTDSLLKNYGVLVYTNLKTKRSYYQYYLPLLKRKNFNIIRFNFFWSNYMSNFYSFYNKIFFKLFYTYLVNEFYFGVYQFLLNSYNNLFLLKLTRLKKYLYVLFNFYFFKSVYNGNRVSYLFYNSQYNREPTFFMDAINRFDTKSLVYIQKLRMLKLRLFMRHKKFKVFRFGLVGGRSSGYIKFGRRVNSGLFGVFKRRIRGLRRYCFYVRRKLRFRLKRKIFKFKKKVYSLYRIFKKFSLRNKYLGLGVNNFFYLRKLPKRQLVKNVSSFANNKNSLKKLDEKVSKYKGYFWKKRIFFNNYLINNRIGCKYKYH